ncbi:Gfo/Idh/MocA family protein [Paenibacillus sp. OV219]|uniref:Gfo/Idh/MocA family protein n=1 Tax=Paenibacillus sp. OV219 TaxID=1884377 RepID=UPI0015A5462B|nr:Gfo/Idh/MocA family oxidoreductase [Paenibacillus sp. OV219]
MKSETGRKLGFGIISASYMAMDHVRGVKANKHAEVKAICDIDLAKAERVAAEFFIQDYYADYTELLKRDDIDVIIVSTPDQLHAEMTIAALEAGKHVLCEKPMALTIEECKQMIDASERTGKKLMVGQICRYAPGFALAKKLIDDGEIGELFYVESEYAHDYSEAPGVGNWRIDPVRLRHPVLGGGCHAVDLLRWIAGNPYEVTAYANRKVLQSWPVDDCTIAIMRFPQDVIGKVMVSVGCKRAYTMRSVFYGNQGTIIVDNTSPTLTIYKDRISGDTGLFNDVNDQTISISHPVNIRSHNTIDEIKEFVDILLNDDQVRTDGVEGASTAAVCLAIVESASTNQSVRIQYDF